MDGRGRYREHGGGQHEILDAAFVHSGGGNDVSGVEVRVGDATDRAAMAAAIPGQDAVIDTVGGKTPYRHTTLEASVATTIVAANTPFYVKIALATYLRGATPDKAKMESTVTGSELDWVITRRPERPAARRIPRQFRCSRQSPAPCCSSTP